MGTFESATTVRRREYKTSVLGHCGDRGVLFVNLVIQLVPIENEKLVGRRRNLIPIIAVSIITKKNLKEMKNLVNLH